MGNPVQIPFLPYQGQARPYSDEGLDQSQFDLNSLSRKAANFAIGLQANITNFSEYKKEYCTLRALPTFKTGNLSRQCRDLLSRVQILSAQRQQQKREKEELQNHFENWLKEAYEPNEQISAQVQIIQKNINLTDGLDQIVMRHGTCNAFEVEQSDEPLACSKDELRWCLCFPCMLIGGLFCNKFVCGTRKIEWLKSGIQKGIAPE